MYIYTYIYIYIYIVLTPHSGGAGRIHPTPPHTDDHTPYRYFFSRRLMVTETDAALLRALRAASTPPPLYDIAITNVASCME